MEQLLPGATNTSAEPGKAARRGGGSVSQGRFLLFGMTSCFFLGTERGIYSSSGQNKAGSIFPSRFLQQQQQLLGSQ